MQAFEPARIGSVTLRNRVLRSATFEGACDPEGRPTAAYLNLYRELAGQGVGALITGFAYTSTDGRAMQPGQAGLESDAKAAAFGPVTEAVHQQGCPIFVQLAHAGRQTSPTATGGTVYGPSARKSSYFNSRPCSLTTAHIERLAREFAAAARRAREAGFDGVQLHAAHGYLIHQFLSPAVNDRNDIYGLDPQRGLGTAFLEEVIARVRSTCGTDYPLLIKISAGDNYGHRPQEREFIELVRFLHGQRLEAIEISFGTMDHALNIFRGESIPVQAILRFNPRYRAQNPCVRLLWKAVVLPLMRRQFAPFAPMYNLPYARLAKRHTNIPIISVGGFRSGRRIRAAIEEQGIDFVSLCRPLLCEPDFVLKAQRDENYQSRCHNCNVCAIMCDSGLATRCYRRSNSTSAVPSAYEN